MNARSGFCFLGHFLLEYLHGVHSGIGNTNGVSFHHESYPVTACHAKDATDILRDCDLPFCHALCSGTNAFANMVLHRSDDLEQLFAVIFCLMKDSGNKDVFPFDTKKNKIRHIRKKSFSIMAVV